MTSIIIPVFNQVHYTKQCIESLRRTVNHAVEIVIVDNGSTDGTAEYLSSVSKIRVLRNKANLGCAAAWNQGARLLEADWTVLLNNDVLLSPCWLEGLLGFAETHDADIVSPAIREGDLNYNLHEYAETFLRSTAQAVRFGVASGICFAVRRRVFEQIGFFDEKFVMGQYEEADFFLRARRSGFRLATTGRSFIHHFGSVTQKALGTQARPYEAQNRAYFRQKWNLNLPRRLVLRIQTKAAQHLASLRERSKYGHTLNEKFVGGKLRYF